MNLQDVHDVEGCTRFATRSSVTTFGLLVVGDTMFGGFSSMRT